MNAKLTWGIVAAILTLGLSGCSGHHMHGGSGVSDDQTQNWKAAAAQYKSCKKVRWDKAVAYAPQWNQLVSGYDDPQYLEKMTSKVPVTKAQKESLIKYRPEQMACRKALLESLGDSNQAVKVMYQKNFNAMDDGIVKVLDGKLKTMGDVNQAYVAYNNGVADRRAQLTAQTLNNR